MKQNLLVLLAAMLFQLSATAQTSYYWSIDKKVPVEFNHQIVSVPFAGSADKASALSTFGFKDSDIKEVTRIHEKINRIDFTWPMAHAYLSSTAQVQIIPSLTIGKQPQHRELDKVITFLSSVDFAIARG